MCGITGFSAPNDNNFDLQNMKLLLVYNSLERGEDALGIFSPINGFKKEAGKPVELLNKFNIQEDNYFIGHVRAHSSGGKKDEHAHPFKHDNLLGVMNGTITNIWALVSKYGLKSMDYDVDSDALFAIIVKNKNFAVLGEIAGGCAVLMNDSENPNILYVYRNIGRPLYRGVINGGMYISSIKESLSIIGCSQIKEFKENTIYTIIDGVIKFNSKIKQDEYKPASNIINYSIIGRDLVGQWLKFDTAGTYHADKYTYGDYYYCFDYNKQNTHMIMVYDDFGKAQEEGKGIFKCYDYKLKPNTSLICLKDIIRIKDNSIIFKKDDIVTFIRYSNDKDGPNDKNVYYSVGRNWMSEHLCRIPTYLLRPLTDSENKEWEALNDISAKEPTIPFIEDLPYVNNVEDDEREEEEEDNIENEVIVSIPQVQLDSLIGDINNSLNKLKEQTFEVTDDKLQTKLISSIAEIEESITNKVKEIIYY